MSNYLQRVLASELQDSQKNILIDLFLRCNQGRFYLDYHTYSVKTGRRIDQIFTAIKKAVNNKLIETKQAPEAKKLDPVMIYFDHE